MNDTDKIYIYNEEYFLIKEYKDVEKYRHSLNSLVRRTYGFDFEEWYQQGYWGDKYRPYSLLHNDEVVANVSVNPIDFLMEGELLSTIQIGTVMTDERYRHRGLSRKLIELVLEEYENACDIIYLYANDTVLEFYPKYGFKEASEYIYTKVVDKSKNQLTYRKINMKEPKDKAIVTRLASNTIPVSRYQMVENPELMFFYLTAFMSDSIYYFEELDLIAIAEIGENNMTLLDVYSEKKFDLDQVINSFVWKDGVKVSLGFTPLDKAGFCCERLKEEGLTFFVKGKKTIDKGRFPALSHA